MLLHAWAIPYQRRSPSLSCSRTGRGVAGPAAAGDFDYWAIEVSSYQATDLPCATPVVAVTSLHPDHLDWHGDVECY